MNKGALIYEDYIKLIEDKVVLINNHKPNQIQPSSIDLTLSSECYEIKASFLTPESKVRDDIEKLALNKINLENTHVFLKNKTYLVRLNERLDLNNDLFGKCNPKSSTGRLDIFCRTVLDFSDEYEKIPKNYSGEIFLEITSRSFDIELTKNDSLNQMRLISINHDFISDAALRDIHSNNPIIFNNLKEIKKAEIDNGLKISVDLKENDNFSTYVAKKNTPIINFSKINFHKINQYWDCKKSYGNSIMIQPGEFYILKSKEKIKIPNNMAGEMIPYDTGIGDFRVHYAGFFDPGFGDPHGSYAVLEVKTNEVPFILRDGQVIARIKYERLNKISKVVYGSTIKSNYQNQGLALSKHFEKKSI